MDVSLKTEKEVSRRARKDAEKEERIEKVLYFRFFSYSLFPGLLCASARQKRSDSPMVKDVSVKRLKVNAYLIALRRCGFVILKDEI